MIWKLRDPIQLHAERRRAEVTASLLKPGFDDVILDVGCGDCYHIHRILKYCPHTVGIDISLEKLREGKRMVSEASLIRASSESLPFQPRVFNKIICLELLEHLRDPSKTIKEMHYALREEGILIISLPYKEQITMTKCIHCGKLTPLWGHLQSFDEEKLFHLLPRNYRLVSCEYVGTMMSSYHLFNRLPVSLWKVVDTFSRILPSIGKPSWFISKFEKSQ